MGKKYIPKRLEKENLRLRQYSGANSTNCNVQTPAKRSRTSTERPPTSTTKKLNTARTRIRNRSNSAIDIAADDDNDDDDEGLSLVDNNDDDFLLRERSFDNVNIIISIGMILNLVNRLSCPSCRRVGKMSQKVNQRRGLLYHITFSCQCSFETSITNSKTLTHSSTARMDELNMMTCAAAHVAGIKRTGMTVILGMLNILPPVQIENWQKYNKIYSDALSKVTDASLRVAGREAAEQSLECADHERVTNVKVSIDGTWPTRRGHSSLHGVATVCSTADPSKVLDFQCLSRHCTTCSGLSAIKDHDPEKYQRLFAEHVASGCEANHSGSSVGMESAGIVKVFQRSEAKHLLRYTTYVGDGDANNEQALSDAKPYGDDVPIRRLQCINHFSKRMRTALETLKKSYKGTKLKDGLTIGGRNGRLTDDKIHQLTVYYGSAIRSHVNDLESMKTACWAAFYHYNSTRDNPNHDYCDPEKCHFYRFKSFDPNKHSLSPAVMDAILPVYEKMCSDAVLSKVVGGGSTNSNESYHSYIWSLCPKTQFHSGTYVRNAASLAAVFYNDGYLLSIMKLLDNCGVRSLVPACRRMLNLIDSQRVKEQSFKSATTRQQERQGRLKLEERLNQVEKYTYTSGGFD